MPSSKLIKAAGGWQFAQLVVSIVSQFLYISLMGRLLEKSDFGLMAIASGLIGLGVVFSEGGMGAALIQRTSITQRHMNAALQGTFAIGLILSLLMFAGAESLANYFRSAELELIIYAVAPIVLINSIGGVAMSMLHKQLAFKKTALVTISANVVGYGVGAYLAMSGVGVWSLVCASLAISIISAVGYFALSPIKFEPSIYIYEWRELFHFSSGMILLKIANYMSDAGLNLIIGRFLPMHQLGVFERSSKLKALPSRYLGNLLDTVMFPAMSQVKDREDKLYGMYRQTLGLSLSLTAPMAILLVIYGHELVAILLGSNWKDAVLPFQIMIAVLPLAGSGRMADAVIRAKGLVYRNAARKYIFVAALISSSILGAGLFGVPGVAAAIASCHILNYVLMVILVKGIFGKSFGEVFFEPIIASLRVSSILMCLMSPFVFVKYATGDSSIPSFVGCMMFVFAGLAAIAWKRPAYLGPYLASAICNLRAQERA